jgi:pimeloyl-ACP methyl ester carboxylesterase
MPRLNQVVLVHGASHGAFCWEALVPVLEGMGYQVSTPDLPGLGADQTPVAEVTMQAYIDRVVETVNAAPEPVLLMGHSMGGAVVCGVAETIPERVGKLVILAGLVPQDGESMGDLMRRVVPDLTPEPAADGALDFDPSGAAEIFYNTCAPDVAERATAQLRRQAQAPFTHPFRQSAERFGSVPKTYIVCLQDRAVPIPLQEELCARTPGMKRREMDTDHSPFLCDPEGLAAIVDEEARV